VNKDKKNWKLETKLVHGYDGDPATGATAVPIHQSVSFAHDTAKEISDIFNNRTFGYTYSRVANPTIVALENHITLVEEGLGSVGVATGMGATSIALQALVRPGDNIVSGNSLFGGTYYLLQELINNHGVTVTFVEASDSSAYENAITPETKVIFCETIGNPKLDVPDISAISKIAQNNNIPFVVDSTTATKYLIDLKGLGVSVAVQSATKWLGGQGTTIAGLITDLGNYKWTNSKSPAIDELSKKQGGMAFLARCKKLRSNLGVALSPMNAFVIQSGMETLCLRFERQCQNAQAVAEFLDAHPDVVKVSYPGLKTDPFHSVAKKQFLNGQYGGLLTFQLADRDACFTCIDKLNIIKNLANLGDNKSLAVHPESTIYRDISKEEKDAAGALQNLIRFSTGLEAIEDIISDLKQALDNEK
jgi:O-acetylhomoserine (thiol)-lyase